MHLPSLIPKRILHALLKESCKCPGEFLSLSILWLINNECSILIEAVFPAGSLASNTVPIHQRYCPKDTAEAMVHKMSPFQFTVTHCCSGMIIKSTNSH